MRKKIDAIAFDIDGTLYSNWALYRRLVFFALKNVHLLVSFGKVRREIRYWQLEYPGEAHPDFFAWQGELLAPYLKCTPKQASEILRKKIYEGWRPVFRKVKPFPHVKEAFQAFKDSGLKIGLLSDFRPDQKESLWGLEPYCDVILGAELIGALKPSPVPFIELADSLCIKPERILYVGNSYTSDVEGAAGIGMKTALKTSHGSHSLAKKSLQPDISFSNYRQLIRNVLE
ncbi:HAD family hydrolase [Brucepastera parasyntrophica]|uniref:HAD family hydrolase n=1 Tax=Brucepastera parasyntrophica TaxID=2880008 RepID=UPI002108C60C|nr:HAD family hydrolase [Brucepastera parasyntrophica]ULQ60552.1 HAD family hydrolase [Brucepastera parasyntrophica]